MEVLVLESRLGELIRLDGLLIVDNKAQAETVQVLASFGGLTGEEMARRMLRRLITTNLALSYNMTGVKGKQSFNGLRELKRTVYEACRQVFSTTSDCSLDKNCGAWFSSARDRDGGRRTRVLERQGPEPVGLN